MEKDDQELAKQYQQAVADPNTRLAKLVKEVDRFDRECTSAEYTDTEAAWELLYHIQGTLKEIIAGD